MLPPFDALTNPDDFEALTFDLLQAEGFEDLIWRGPGPDGGRDLEAAWQTHDPTGHALRTRWYIECKLYSSSVPFSEIEPKLLAALCAKADYLLIVTSSRVMNTAMDSVQRWLDTRAHPFRIRYWNGQDVIRRVARHRNIYDKYFAPQTSLPWAAGDAEAARLRKLLGNSSERSVASLVPGLQWASQHLEMKCLPTASSVVAEIGLLLANLRLQQLLSSGNDFAYTTTHSSMVGEGGEFESARASNGRSWSTNSLTTQRSRSRPRPLT